MKILFCKKQVILLVMAIPLCGGADGFSVKHAVQNTMTSLDRVTAPFSHNMACYTQCNQKIGRHGGEAFQDYFHKNKTKSSPDIMKALQGQQYSSSDTEKQARQALACLRGCGAALTVRFLAQFLGSIQEEEAVRALGVLLGSTSYKEGKPLGHSYLAHENGHESKLFGGVFKKPFHRGCLRVLRHEQAKRVQFRKNMAVLKQVFFEMYGPVRKAEEYAKAYGLD